MPKTPKRRNRQRQRVSSLLLLLIMMMIMIPRVTTTTTTTIVVSHAPTWSQRIRFRGSNHWTRRLDRHHHHHPTSSSRPFAFCVTTIGGCQSSRPQTTTTPLPLLLSLNPVSLVYRPSGVTVPTRPFPRPWQLTSLSLLSSSSSSNNNLPLQPYDLVIVESPSKCETLSKILNTNNNDNNQPYYYVTSCKGHIRNLVSSVTKTRELLTNDHNDHHHSTTTNTNTTTTALPMIAGIDIHHPTHPYRPLYELLPRQRATVKELQHLARTCQTCWLATDPDREGEAMAQALWEHVLVPVQCTSYQRLVFTEITPTAVQNAIQQQQQQHSSSSSSIENVLNPHLLASQETRRVLDRLVGYTVSPLLWKKIAPGLSAGRVQSVALSRIVQRELERMIFQSTNYWTVQGTFGWTITNNNDNDNNKSNKVAHLTASLTEWQGQVIASSAADFAPQGQCLKPEKQDKLHLPTNETVQWLVQNLTRPGITTTVASIRHRPHRDYGPDPFRTATLQQEAVRKVGLTVQQTMQTAQWLYENGFISYMRTDATHLSKDAEDVIAKQVKRQFGSSQYNQKNDAKTTKQSKKKSDGPKFAQEAHEAIRPAITQDGTFAKPESLTFPDTAKSQLYTLIYQRTLASRMVPMVSNRTTIVLHATDDEHDHNTPLAEFRASASVVLEPGYTAAYAKTTKDDSESDNETDENGSQQIIPPLVQGQRVSLDRLLPNSHHTQPPPRFTEASFVKELEDMGVGRPSTYAKIVQILRDRAYVGNPISATSNNTPPRGKQKEVSGSAISAKRAAGGDEFVGSGRGPLVPSLSAFVVTNLLQKHCPMYVDPEFTAKMEEQLDKIASGEGPSEEQRVKYLDDFYAGDNGLAAQIRRIDETLSADEARKVVLPALEHAKDDDKDVTLLIGPWGPYVKMISDGDEESSDKPTSAPLPPGMAADLTLITPQSLKTVLSTKAGGGVLLGQHPKDGRNIRLKVGRFGAYLQWGDDDEEGTTTHSLPRHMTVVGNIEEMPDDGSEEPASLSSMIGITLDEAVGYVSLPRTVCTFNDLPIVAAIGPYGPYLKYDNKFVSLNPKDGDVLTVDAEMAERLVTDGIINRKRGLGRGVLAEIGEKNGAMITVKKGRFGEYINWKKVNAKLPASYMDDPSELPLEEAWELIQAKAGAQIKSSSTANKANPIELPPAPTRPMSAYLRFCADKRPEVSETAKTLGEISKKLATLWKETSEDEREPYEKQVAIDKKEYEAKKLEWKKTCEEIINEASTKGGSGKKLSASAVSKANRPKRPKSAYMFFCADKREDVSKRVKTLGETSKELARLWAEIDDRTEYEQLAAADKERYELEKQGLASANASSTNVVELRTHGGVRRKNGSKENKESKPRAPSAYMLFCRDRRPHLVDSDGNKLPFGEAAKKLAELWENLDDKSRAEFQQQAAIEKEKLLLGS